MYFVRLYFFLEKKIHLVVGIISFSQSEQFSYNSGKEFTKASKLEIPKPLKLAAFKPSFPEFGYLPFTIPSISEIDNVTGLKENNTRFHVGLIST